MYFWGGILLGKVGKDSPEAYRAYTVLHFLLLLLIYELYFNVNEINFLTSRVEMN